MTPFLFECHISICSYFALKVVRGHEFWTHLKTLVVIFDLLAFILNNGTVSGEMRSQVALMLWEVNLAQVIRGHCMRNFVTCSTYK